MVSSILGLGSSSYAGKTSMDGVLLDLIRTSFLRSGRLKFYDCVWKSCKPQHSKTHRLRCQLGLGYQRRGYLSTSYYLSFIIAARSASSAIFIRADSYSRKGSELMMRVTWRRPCNRIYLKTRARSRAGENRTRSEMAGFFC